MSRRGVPVADAITAREEWPSRPALSTDRKFPRQVEKVDDDGGRDFRRERQRAIPYADTAEISLEPLPG